MNKPDINKDYFGCFPYAKGRMTPCAIVVHHTCTSSHKRTRQALLSKRYSTHFEVEKDGTIYQYVDIHTKAAHCGGPNFCTIGIDITHIAGAEFTDAQVKSANALINWLCEELNIEKEIHHTLTGVYPHRALSSTECPQNFPFSQLFKD